MNITIGGESEAAPVLADGEFKGNQPEVPAIKGRVPEGGPQVPPLLLRLAPASHHLRAFIVTHALPICDLRVHTAQSFNQATVRCEPVLNKSSHGSACAAPWDADDPAVP